MEQMYLNKTYKKKLPQDAVFACLVNCKPNGISSNRITLDKFYSIASKRLYISLKGNDLDDSGEMYLSVEDGYSGRKIMDRVNVRNFTPNYKQGMNSYLLDAENFKHYFRDLAPINFIVENTFDKPVKAYITVIGERFFTGINQGSDFAGEIELMNTVDVRNIKEIEYTYLPKPISCKFTSHLKNGKFIFDVKDNEDSGQFINYKLNPLSRYKLTELNVQSSLPEGVFAGAVSKEFLFNLRSSKKQSMIATPYKFNSHILRTEIESYLQNNNSDQRNYLIGNLYGELEQTTEIVRLGYNKVSIIINCVVYEGKENVTK